MKRRYGWALAALPVFAPAAHGASCPGTTFDTEFVDGMGSAWGPAAYTDPGMMTWELAPGEGPEDANVYWIKDGVLTISIQPTPPDAMAVAQGHSLLGGILTTKDSFAQTYGYFETAAQLPSGGAGLTSAFWLIPSSGAWPPEIDVFEEDTGASGTNAVETGMFSMQTGSNQQTFQWQYNLPDLSAGLHTFGVDWQAGSITWYLDGRQVFQADTPGDFHQPMYLLLDAMAANGGWNGSASPQTLAAMTIQYVRAYPSKAVADANPCGTSPQTASKNGTSGQGLTVKASAKANTTSAASQAPADPGSTAATTASGQTQTEIAQQAQLSGLSNQIGQDQQAAGQLAQQIGATAPGAYAPSPTPDSPVLPAAQPVQVPPPPDAPFVAAGTNAAPPPTSPTSAGTVTLQSLQAQVVSLEGQVAALQAEILQAGAGSPDTTAAAPQFKPQPSKVRKRQKPDMDNDGD